MKRLPRQQLMIYAFYLAVAVLITWPLVTVLSTRLVGDEASDAYEMGRHIWWFKHALQTGQPLFFQPNLGYPDGISGVSLWADPLQFFPAWLFAFFMPIPSAYNLTILLTMALNGWAMYWLSVYSLQQSAQYKDLTQRRKEAKAQRDDTENSTQHSALSTPYPSLLAGIVFMTFPTMQGHLLGGHAGLLVMWPVPLFLYALFRYLEADVSRDAPTEPQPHTGRKWRWFALAVLFFVLSPGGHALQLIYVLLPIVGLIAVTLLYKRDSIGFWRVVAVSLVSGLFLLIFLLPVIGETVETPAYTEAASSSVRYSADLLGIVSPSPQHPFFGNLLEYPHRVLGVNLVEGSTYIGIVAAVLSLIAMWKYRGARWWLLLALVAWMLSLGPLLKIFDAPLTIQSSDYESYVPLPFALIQNLPFFNLARTPGRFSFVLALAVAMLAAYGAQTIWKPRLSATPPLRVRGGGWGEGFTRMTTLFLLLTAAVLWEYQSFWPVPTVSGEIPDAVRALSERNDVRAVFNIPYDDLRAAKDALYLQTAHEKPLIAGHVTRQTPVNPAKLTLLQDTLDPSLLDEAGADIIILHKYWDDPTAVGPVETFAREKLGTPSYEDDLLALFEAPEVESEAEFLYLTPEPLAQIGEAQDVPDGYADYTEAYLYLPEAAWVDFAATLDADGREVALYLDGERLHNWTVNGQISVQLSLPIAARGYHTVTLALEPSCPPHHNPTLTCRTLSLRDVEFTLLQAGALYDPIPLENGVQLLSAFMPAEAAAGTKLPVSLWWHFDEATTKNDVRFLHVLDVEGENVAQLDSALEKPADSAWIERLEVELPADLPAGEYVVYGGWYTYPDLVRFRVLADRPGAADGLLYLGTFSVTR